MQTQAATIVGETRTMCRCCKNFTNHSESRCWSNPAGRSYGDRQLGTRASLRDMLMNAKVYIPSNSPTSDTQEEGARAQNLSKLEEQQRKPLGLLTDGLPSKADALDQLIDTKTTVEASTAYELPLRLSSSTKQSEGVEAWAGQKRKIEEASADRVKEPVVEAGPKSRTIFKCTTKTVDGSLGGRRIADSIETIVYDANGKETVIDKKIFDEKKATSKDGEEASVQVSRPKAVPPHLRQKTVRRDSAVNLTALQDKNAMPKDAATPEDAAAPKNNAPPPVQAAPEANNWATFAAAEHQRQMSFKTPESWTKQKAAIEKAKAENPSPSAEHNFKTTFKKTTRTIDGTLNGRRVADSVETTLYGADGSETVLKMQVFDEKQAVNQNGEPKQGEPEQAVRPKFTPPHLKQKVFDEEQAVSKQGEPKQDEPKQANRPKAVPPHLKQRGLKP